jgi:hypothetical protein
MPSSALSIAKGRQAATKVSVSNVFPRWGRVARPVLSAPARRTTTAGKVKKARSPGLQRRTGRTAAKHPQFYSPILKKIPHHRLSMCCDAPCQRDPPMSKSLALSTASHPARHAAASPCDVPRRTAVGRGLPGVLLSHPDPATPAQPPQSDGRKRRKRRKPDFLAPRIPPRRQTGSENSGTPSDADSTDVCAALSPAVRT